MLEKQRNTMSEEMVKQTKEIKEKQSDTKNKKRK
jgi:hypothetical protein